MTHERRSPDIERLTFGQPAENIAASDRNPIKHGIFIRYVGYSMAEYATASGVHSTPADNLRASQPATPTGGESGGCGTPGCTDPKCEYGKGDDAAEAMARSSAATATERCHAAEAFEEADYAVLYRIVDDSGTTTSQEIWNASKDICAEAAKGLFGAAQPKREPVKISEDQIMQVIRKVTSGDLREMLTCKRWKDGIDIDQPTFAAERLAEEFGALAISSTEGK